MTIFGCKMQHYKPLWVGRRKESKSEAISLFALYLKIFSQSIPENV